MSKQAVVALRAERGEVLALAGGLTPEEWAMPSDCRGWSVRDVVAHMGSLFHLLLDPGAAWKAMRAERVESLNDELVDVRRSWSTGQVLDEYETWSRRTLRLLGVVQVPPLGAIRLPLGDLGTYPANLLANSLVFDHYAHLRLDLLAPFGPLDRPVPPSDALRLGPTLEWLLGGIPSSAATPWPGSTGPSTSGSGAPRATCGGSCRAAPGACSSSSPARPSTRPPPSPPPPPSSWCGRRSGATGAPVTSRSPATSRSRPASSTT
ncbi:MAG: maleylpyruvate isomerase family mycothiol-dependent enzyme [Acidimicrobiia bacterium]|nr:maleylpyruvate isomerase family mycothiol-dependent enzyme [Acidimicrobiia bacterium]